VADIVGGQELGQLGLDGLQFSELGEVGELSRLDGPVRVLDQDAAGDGNLSFGGWIWRYDVRSAGSADADVTLTYDWSAVAPELREHIPFPPFDPTHLENSLKHLSDLATAQATV